jgi:hypothetical protein
MSAAAAEVRPRPRGRRLGKDVSVVLAALLAHPSLWWTGIAALARFSRRGWWHRPPFLPIPGQSYWDFRLVTAFGGDGSEAALEPRDVVAFLRWCQRTRPHRG